MTREELAAYYRHLDNIVILRDNIFTERAEGRAEGMAEGRAEGIAEGRAEGMAEGRAEGIAEGMVKGRAEGIAEGRAEGEKQKAMEIARFLKSSGMTIEMICEATGLSGDEVVQL